MTNLDLCKRLKHVCSKTDNEIPFVEEFYELEQR